jgi:acyl-CoA thioesterase
VTESNKLTGTIEKEFARHSLEYLLGFKFFIDEDHQVIIKCPIEQKHLNLRKSVHGGVIAALADTATGVAFSIHEGQPVASATVDLDIKFIKSAKHGTLVARPKVLRRGNRLGFVECEIRDDEDNLIAKASGTFAILNA